MGKISKNQPHSKPTRLDAGEVRAALLDGLEDLARHLLGEPTRRHSTPRQWRWGTQGSLALELARPKRGQWYDHEAGAGGDVFGLIQRKNGGDFPAVLAWAADWSGIAPEAHPRRPPRHRAPAPAPADDAPADARVARALALWDQAQPIQGTLAETYLQHRGIAGELPEALRFHPACPRGSDRLPAMVALMTDPATAEPVGIHRTYLRPDGADRLREDRGEGRGKMMLGRAGVIRLSPDDALTHGLGIAEGMETGLACISAEFAPIWAAGSAGAIARFPVLAGIEGLTLFADTGEAGQDAAETCGQRWASAGREVWIVTPAPQDSDWADTLRRVGMVPPPGSGDV